MKMHHFPVGSVIFPSILGMFVLGLHLQPLSLIMPYLAMPYLNMPYLAAAEWQPADGPLMTRWAKDVSPESVWPEYPRPQMVRATWNNLNGLWDYAIRPRDEKGPPTWDGKILVPFPVESALSGVKKRVGPDQRLWYRRSFDLPSIDPEQRWLLHFGAVDWQTTVSVNGQKVAEHEGGYDPFTIDVTESLASGANELIVSVWDPTDSGSQPKGKQVLKPHGIMYTAVTGIWQTVWLERVPRRFIQSLDVVPDVDRSLVRITTHAPADLTVRLIATDDGRKCGEAVGTSSKPMELAIDAPKLWSPDSPHLYDLKVELLDGREVVDSVESYFGMRKIEVGKDHQGINRLMLNDEPLFHFGPLDQGWWPDGLYTPATDQAIKHDIVMTKKYGMNMARKHVKVESARWYYWCDRLGLLVWQDMPSGDAGRNAESKANYRRELKAMIEAFGHFPSIVMWVPFNEGWGQHDTPEVVAWIEQFDPTRPVNEASGWTDVGSGTVSDMHSYPGPGMRNVEEKRVSVLGEYGGLGLPITNHTWQAEKNWGYRSYENQKELTDAYIDLLVQMRPLIGRGLSAAVYTQTSDVEIEVNGLMTYDREIDKINVARAAEAARKLYLPPPVVKTVVPTSQSMAQTWRFTLKKPSDGWQSAAWDDSDWTEAAGGFGQRGTPGAVIGTEWTSSDIWIRRSFDLTTVPADGEICLMIHHDEDAEVHINGTLVKSLEGYSSNYQTISLGSKGIKALKSGRNVLAIHCRQTRGGQYIDAGVVLLLDE